MSRWFGPVVIKGGIEIYDKNVTEDHIHTRARGSKHMTNIDDKFMEPGFKGLQSVHSGGTEPQEIKPIEPIDLKDIEVDTQAATKLPPTSELVSIKPNALPTPEFIQGDFLESDRSERPLQKSKVDFSKLPSVDTVALSQYFEKKLHKSTANSYKFRPK